MRRFAAIALTFAILFSVCMTAWAENGNVTYQANARKFIFAPGSSYSPTDLFPNFKDVMPGDTLTQQITVRNDKRNKVKVRLYMRSLGASDAESKEFLSQLEMTVVKKTNTIYFNDTPDQPSTLKDWTYLGLLYSSGECDLEVQLHVPETLDNTFQERIGVLDWEFMVEELPISADDPPPKTGDISPIAVAASVAAGTGLILLFLLARKKQERKSV